MAGTQAGDTLLFEDVSFSCAPGEWLLLCGPSGAGKTSLLRAVNGLHPLSNGSMRVLGSLLPGRSATESRAVWRRTGTVLQDLGLFESRTALGNVELPLLMTGLRARSRTELARSVIARLALDAVADRFPCELSGGQRQRVALARATVAKPALLILDEPTSAMDVRTAEIAFDLLAELKHQGTAIIMSSHRTAECMGVCDRIVEMRNGRIIRNDECRGLAAGTMRSRAVS